MSAVVPLPHSAVNSTSSHDDAADGELALPNNKLIETEFLGYIEGLLSSSHSNGKTI
jgi:hypothetical protein